MRSTPLSRRLVVRQAGSPVGRDGLEAIAEAALESSRSGIFRGTQSARQVASGGHLAGHIL